MPILYLVEWPTSGQWGFYIPDHFISPPAYPHPGLANIAGARWAELKRVVLTEARPWTIKHQTGEL